MALSNGVNCVICIMPTGEHALDEIDTADFQKKIPVDAMDILEPHFITYDDIEDLSWRALSCAT